MLIPSQCDFQPHSVEAANCCNFITAARLLDLRNFETFLLRRRLKLWLVLLRKCFNIAITISSRVDAQLNCKEENK